ATSTAPPPTGHIRDRYEGPGSRRDVRRRTTPYRAWYHRRARPSGTISLWPADGPRRDDCTESEPSAPRAHGDASSFVHLVGVSGPGDDHRQKRPLAPPPG